LLCILFTTFLDETDGNDFFVFNSAIQGRSIDLERFATFVEEYISPIWSYGNDNIGELSSHFRDHKHIFDDIAEGFDIWNRDGFDPRAQAFRSKVFNLYGRFFTNQQAAERLNKEQNMAASNNRKESNISIRLVAGSLLKEICSASVIGKKRTAFRGLERVTYVIDQICSFNEKVEHTKDIMGEEKYKRQHNEAKESLRSSFAVQRTEHAREEFEATLTEQHVPSARERVSGVDRSACRSQQLQFGKLHKKDDNLDLLRKEWAGRKATKMQRPLRTVEKDLINLTGIMQIKKAIRDHENLRAEAAEEGDYTERYFKQQYTEYDEYSFDLVS
jgi:hypothetical protein